MIIKTDSTNRTKRNQRFEALCRLTQRKLKAKLRKELKATGRYVESGDGYLYCEGEIPILLCAHMDTVHKETPKEVIYSWGEITSPQGIGGDDRCGIYMVMNIIREYKCHVIFFEDEEVGGVGSNKFTKTDLCNSLKGKFNYVIEFDRKGSNDAVFYECDNREFTKFVTKEFWHEAYGSFTDTCVICPVLGVAGVNLSCGYYNAHTTKEYVVLDEMETAIMEAKKMIARTTDTDKFEYIEEEKPRWSLYGRYDDLDRYDDYYDNYYGRTYTYSYKSKKKLSASDFQWYCITFMSDKGEEVYEVCALSDTEAVGYFVTDYPDKTFNDIISIDPEEDTI